MDTKFIKTFLKDNLIWFTAFIYLIIIFYASVDSSDTIYQHSYFYSIIIAAPILFSIFYAWKNSKTDVLTTIMVNKAILAPVIIFVLLIFTISFFDIAITSFVTTILLYTMLIVGAIISAKVFESYLYSLEGYPGVIARIILFIPCMLNDLFNFIVGEFGRSPFVVYVLLGIEFALFAAYKLLPKLLYSPATNAGHILQKRPVLLKNETKCQPMSSFNPEYKDSIKKSRAYSFWVYLLEMSPSVHPYNDEANIFRIDGQTRCKVTYKNNSLGDADNKTKREIKSNCRIYLGDSFKEFSILPQKWTYVVINDQPANLELFVDGKLVISEDTPVNSRTPLNVSDHAVLGQNNGLQGGICNVQYFPYYIGDLIVKRYHSLYKDMDPPVDDEQ